MSTTTSGNPERKWLLVPLIIAASLAGSCSRGAHPVRLELSLHAGMERMMRVEVRERFAEALPRGGRGVRRNEAVSATFTASMTYRFRVLSVDAEGVAKIRSEVVEAGASPPVAHLDELLPSLRSRSSLLFLDRSGRIQPAEARRLPQSGLFGSPFPPESLSSPGPALGDLQALLGGVSGRVVSVGETWTSTAQPAQAAGLGGTLCWTVESIASEGVRLGFRGTIEERPIALFRPQPGESAHLSGSISGFVVLERITGWPLQGKTFAKIEVIRTKRGTPFGRERPLFSLTAVTLFDPAR